MNCCQEDDTDWKHHSCSHSMCVCIQASSYFLPFTWLESDITQWKMFQRQFIFCMLCKGRWVAGETPKPTQPTTASPSLPNPKATPWEPATGVGADICPHRCCNWEKTFNSGTPVKHKAPLTKNQILLLTSAHKITSEGLFFSWFLVCAQTLSGTRRYDCMNTEYSLKIF